MAKEEIKFNDFLVSVEPDNQDFIRDLHDYLVDNDCKEKIESKSSGYFVTYAHGKTKKSVINLLFRKKGLIIRIYGENVGKYLGFINSLPPDMVKAINKAGVCKRLVNPDACNPRCTTGYDFVINGLRYQKCKNSCFQFDINSKNNPFIRTFCENEVTARA